MSYVDNNTLNYHHIANDYRPGGRPSGCSSCGGGVPSGGSELMSLKIERRHRYRDQTWQSSFGPGVYCNYDTKLAIYQGESGWIIDVFDPNEDKIKRLTLSSGVYVDDNCDSIKQLELFTAGDVSTTDPTSATYAILTNYRGVTFRFEIINLDDNSSDYEDRLNSSSADAFKDGTDLLGHWRMDDGSGSTVTDSSGNSWDGTLVNATWTADEGGHTGSEGDYAIQFDGNGDYVALGDDSVTITGPITISAWIKADTRSWKNSIVVQGYDRNYLWMGQSWHDTIGEYDFYDIGAYNGYPPARHWWDYDTYYYRNNYSNDLGVWVHMLGTYDGHGWRLYRNGLLVKARTDPIGGINAAANWAIGATGGYGSPYFDGLIDEVRIYKRGLTPAEVRLLAEDKVGRRAGRLTHITDRNGHGVTVTYKTFTQQQLDASPDLQWQIDTVTDAYGLTAEFSYNATQQSGRWAVSEIDLPGSRTLTYTYSSGKLSNVDHPDGSDSTLSYGSNGNLVSITFVDPDSQGGHVQKTAYVSGNFVVTNATGSDWAGEVFNQSAQMLRVLVNEDGEAAYYSFADDDGSGNDLYLYEGSGKLRKVDMSLYSRYYNDGWTIDATDGVDGITGSLETYYASIDPYGSLTASNYSKGTIPYIRDAQNRIYTYTYDSHGFKTQKTYPYSGGTEQWSYDSAKPGYPLTRYKDRSNRVTKYSYDSDGNLLYKEVGILYVPGTGDVNQTEHAYFTRDYYVGTETVDGVTQPAGMLKCVYAASTTTTPTELAQRYVYNANKRLWKIYEPNDTGGYDSSHSTGEHVAVTYTYDASGRVYTMTDAAGRHATYAYDCRDRVISTTYGDTSTEQRLYGTGSAAGQLIATKDRNGSVTKYTYDDTGRRTETAVAVDDVGPSGTILTSYTPPTSGNYDATAAVTTYTYVDGTDQVATVTSRGNTTSYDYDTRGRVIETTVTPNDVADSELTTTRTYVQNMLFKTTDPYGRKTYYNYRPSDGTLTRTVQGTVPAYQITNTYYHTSYGFYYVHTASRDSNPNATRLVTDYTLDTSGRVTTVTDPRNIQHTTTYDSRGRTTQQIAAYSTADAATSQTVYDIDGRVTTVRNPRYFDAGDTNGYQKAYDTYTYTRRGLRATHTAAAGADDYVAPTSGTWSADKCRVSESWTYNDDRTLDTHTDFRGNVWDTDWSTCCAGRVEAQYSPPPSGYSYPKPGVKTQYDEAGNVVYVRRISLGQSSETIYSQTTTRYDARHRPTARTVWLVEQNIATDETHPPIAGGGEGGDPALEISGVKQGLTTRWLYDEDLQDGVGLDNASGVQVDELDGAGSFYVKLGDLIGELEDDLNSGSPVFDTGCVGSAVVVINPEEEISVSIQDALGRTVASGVIAQDGTPITWSTVKHDAVVEVSGYGDCVETARIDALNHQTKSRADAVGRVMQSIDALSEVTSMQYDANGNLLRVRDPNSVGWDAGTSIGTFNGYDYQNRLVARIDTEGDTSSTEYDKVGNVVEATDAKSHDTTFAYDARGQKLTQTDRISGVTTWRFDENGNLLHLTDADNQAGSDPTIWTYNTRNQKLTVAYPGHNPASSVGDSDYDKKVFTYDSVGRPDVFYDQQGDTVDHTFDMAGRLLQRDYRLAVNSPSGTIADSDEMAYDDAGRTLTAESGRYSNTATFVYGDGAGRVTSESITLTLGTQRTYTVQSDYDDAGNRVEITYPDSSVVERSYTNRDQLYQIEYDSNNVATYSYADNGRRTGRTLGDSASTATTWTYGRDDNLPTAITTSGVCTFGYTYDDNKNKLTETLGAPMADYGFDSTTYDNEDRLTAWSRVDDNKDQEWELSAAGDWESFTEEAVEVERTHNDVHELTAVGQTSLTYDAKGNLTKDGAQTYAKYIWDFDNRLQAVDTDDDDTSEVFYTYDALGRRLTKSIVVLSGYGGSSASSGISRRSAGGRSITRRGASTTVTTTTVFVPDGQQEVAEYTYVSTVGTPNLTKKYVYASYIDEPVLMLNVSGETETKYYYHQNSLYSVAALTDQSGTVVERYSYLAYGAITFHDADGSVAATQESTVANPYLFTGRRLDPETSLQYSRARYYHFNLGRWISRDPIGYLSRDVNLYRYVGNKVLISMDPSGTVDPNSGCCFEFRPDTESGGTDGEAPYPIPDATWLDSDGSRHNYSRDEYDKKLKIDVNDNIAKDFLDLGCVGLCALRQGQRSLKRGEYHKPNNYPGTRCFLDFPSTKQVTCKKGETRFVFAVQGEWAVQDKSHPPEGNPNPLPNEVDRRSIYTNKPDEDHEWNFGTYHDGVWEWGNHGIDDNHPRNKQRFSICKSLPSDEDYPHTIYCVSCISPSNAQHSGGNKPEKK